MPIRSHADPFVPEARGGPLRHRPGRDSEFVTGVTLPIDGGCES